MALSFDVVVVGGGHAGCEAAAAAARMGARTALVTLSAASIGTMSCNPAIGGLGKSQLVREIDALDGLMGLAADRAGIQFRLLNRRKGPAVRGLRAQADRRLYSTAIRELLDAQPGLTILEGEVSAVLSSSESDRRVVGVDLAEGGTLSTQAVVLTTGTFLRGLIHIGDRSFAAGRMNDPASVSLAASLEGLGFRLGRLKTGTPPRLAASSVNWNAVELQSGDVDPGFFSVMTRDRSARQIACGITRTNSATHDIIRANIGRSALYGGRIEGVGPRYCPSVEDKVVRFGDRDGHQVFLEPEGLESDLIYPNGISTSLPEDVQTALVQSISGLECARIVQPGYAIEYDHVDPRDLHGTLETRAMHGLFLAGQINGTTGYEEAGAQGLLAGLNAARRAHGIDPVSLSRTGSYIGVMVDDLTTRGVTEPYRMFTSRAEFRLSLRCDNADERLTEWGASLGVVGEERARLHRAFVASLESCRKHLKEVSATPAEAVAVGVIASGDGRRRSGYELLSYPGVEFARLVALWPELAGVDDRVKDAVSIEAAYSVYLERQHSDITQIRREEQLVIPHEMDFSLVPSLSNELRQKLATQRPSSMAAAARMEGMTPAALVVIASHLRAVRAGVA